MSKHEKRKKAGSDRRSPRSKTPFWRALKSYAPLRVEGQMIAELSLEARRSEKHEEQTSDEVSRPMRTGNRRLHEVSKRPGPRCPTIEEYTQLCLDPVSAILIWANQQTSFSHSTQPFSARDSETSSSAGHNGLGLDKSTYARIQASTCCHS